MEGSSARRPLHRSSQQDPKTAPPKDDRSDLGLSQKPYTPRPLIECEHTIWHLVSGIGPRSLLTTRVTLSGSIQGVAEWQ